MDRDKQTSLSLEFTKLVDDIQETVDNLDDKYKFGDITILVWRDYIDLHYQKFEVARAIADYLYAITEADGDTKMEIVVSLYGEEMARIVVIEYKEE